MEKKIITEMKMNGKKKLEEKNTNIHFFFPISNCNNTSTNYNKRQNETTATEKIVTENLIDKNVETGRRERERERERDDTIFFSTH